MDAGRLQGAGHHIQTHRFSKKQERVLFMSLLYVRRLPNSRIRWLKLVLNQLQGEAWSYRDWLTQSSLPQPYRGWWLPGPWWVSASKGKEGQA